MAPADKARLLHRLAFLNGVTCAAIGTLHLARGTEGVPGLAEAGVSEDSQESFYGGIFAGYGLAWVWVARQRPIPATPVRFLSAVMALGGLGRLNSMRRRGLPHPFWTALTGVEFVVPALFCWLVASVGD